MTIDDHWFKKATPEGLVQAAEVDLEKVMADAEDEYVRIMLYHDRKKGDVPNEEVFNLYSALGASGMKYGFHGNQAGFTRDAMKNAAKHSSVISIAAVNLSSWSSSVTAVDAMLEAKQPKMMKHKNA